MAEATPDTGGAGLPAAGAAGPGAGSRPTWRPTFLLLTCEHGGHDIPEPYRHRFAGAEDTLRSHRGWDPGALALARSLAADLAAPLVFSTTSRLLVELNRSEGHGDLFSEYTRGLPGAEREELLARHYHPYRASVQRILAHAIAAGERALHLSVHSFTPHLGGEVRTVQVGVLFDPDRASEAAIADWWLPRLGARGLDARPNEPYKGTDDGLTTVLRTRFPSGAYAGLELEVRNNLLTGASAAAIGADLAADIGHMLDRRFPPQPPANRA